MALQDWKSLELRFLETYKQQIREIYNNIIDNVVIPSSCACGAWIDTRQFDAGICICPKCQALDEEKARFNLVAIDLSRAGVALTKSLTIRPWGVKS